LVQGDIAARLRRAGVEHCLRPVLNAKTGEELEVVQLVPMATLPPFHASSAGIKREGPCQVCNRDGYYGLPGAPYRLHYEALSPAFRGLDLMGTFERFGVSRLREPFRESVFAAPVLIAGGRLLDVLTTLSLRHVELEEVTVEWGAGPTAAVVGGH
jgi:hypothetical protein